MTTDYTPLSPPDIATLPGVQIVDVVGDILVVMFSDDSSIAVTSAPLAVELGLEKWNALVCLRAPKLGDEQHHSLTTAELLELIKRHSSSIPS